MASVVKIRSGTGAGGRVPVCKVHEIVIHGPEEVVQRGKRPLPQHQRLPFCSKALPEDIHVHTSTG